MTERSIERKSGDFNRASIFLNKLLESGFDEATVFKINESIRVSNHPYMLLGYTEMPVDFYKFLKNSISPEALPTFLINSLKYPNGVIDIGYQDSQIQLLNDVWMESKKNRHISSCMKILVVPNSVPINGDIGSVRMMLEILRDKHIFNLFNEDPLILSEYLTEVQNDRYGDVFKEVALSVIHNGKFKKTFLSGLDKSLLSFFDSYRSKRGLETILNSERLAMRANEILKNGPKSWAGKLIDLVEVVNFMGYQMIKTSDVDDYYLSEYAKEIERDFNLNKRGVEEVLRQNPEERFIRVSSHIASKSDRKLVRERILMKQTLSKYELETKENMDRIKRRENPNHPLNTLKIAKTVGHEVEFPHDQITNSMANDGVFEMLGFLGFKQGAGGVRSYETSPGPFYDPLTATTVFNAYCDAGIINLDKYNRFTFHFNVGSHDQLRIGSLARALYLTGAVYDPKVEFQTGVLRLYSNNQGMGSYTECKTFSAITQKDFVWGLKSASYLSWALDADSVKNDSDKFRQFTKWHQELSAIWQNYRHDIYLGLGTLQIYTNLDETNHMRSSQIIANELSKIFVNKSSWYRDLSKVGWDNPNITKIKVQGRVYPNLAFFAREVTDRAVEKIEMLADRLEDEVRDEINSIEKASGIQKEILKKEFENEFKTSFVTAKKLFTNNDALGRIETASILI